MQDALFVYLRISLVQYKKILNNLDISYSTVRPLYQATELESNLRGETGKCLPERKDNVCFVGIGTRNPLRKPQLHYWPSYIVV